MLKRNRTKVVPVSKEIVVVKIVDVLKESKNVMPIIVNVLQNHAKIG